MSVISIRQFESKHVLMPRSTGLEFCVRNLDGNVKHIYDLTLAFSGLSADETPMDKYSLSNMFVHGVVPAQVHLRVRRIPVAEVKPLINTAAESQVVSAVAAVDDQTLLKYAGRLPTLNHSSPKFDAWLLETYNRKDKEMEAFYRDARFPDSPYRVISFGSWEWAWALISRDFSLLKLYTALIVLVLVFRWYYY